MGKYEWPFSGFFTTAFWRLDTGPTRDTVTANFECPDGLT